MARIQENARYAFQILGRDLRMAGYRGCVGENVTVTNTLNDPNGFLWNFDQAIYGYEASSTSTWNLPPDDAITNPSADGTSWWYAAPSAMEHGCCSIQVMRTTQLCRVRRISK